ncbi:phospholipid scramblase 1-like [Hemicordylus capensis]|uniref:phospholipid scramblase 1-like n=1 Tax=Hemicordylus capensis TaxID=884348 RepID=UPI0023037DBD|nr:phospholipid scramblase 1-like [Hemicordylus capensis]
MEMKSPLPPAPEYPGYQATQIPYGFPQHVSQSAVPGQAGSTFPGQQTAYGALPIQAQPTVRAPVIWMSVPSVPSQCPPGLEYLSQIDQILIQQQMELMEMISGYETANRYEIKNTLGQWVYFAAEENDDYTLNRYRQFRPFTIKIFDSKCQVVMQVKREGQHFGCPCPCVCCLQELEVQAPPERVIGYCKQTWHCCLPKYAIQNDAREDMLKIDVSCSSFQRFADSHFEVKSPDGSSTIGRITKQWTGLAREAATDATNFAVQFPLDLDIKMKALMIGSCFLLVAFILLPQLQQ